MEEAAVELDPGTTKHRLFECPKCQAIVASSAWAGVVRIACSACGRVEQRELSLAAPAPPIASPYRETSRGDVDDARTFSLGDVPPGCSAKDLDFGKLRDALAKHAANGSKNEGLAREWERVWLGAWVGIVMAAQGDALRARVALEMTLETTVAPAHRALLLALLAQQAAAVRAPKLAKRWLRAKPEVDVVDVKMQVRVARAMIAHAKDDPEKVVRLTGDRIAGEGYVGQAVLTAIALNIDAHERCGNPHLADHILADLKRRKALRETVLMMQAYRIGLDSLVRFAARARRRNAIGWAASAAFPFVVALVVGRHAPGAVVGAGIVAAAVAAAASWVAFGLEARSRIAAVGARLLGWGVPVLGMVGLLWILDARALLPVRPPAETKPGGAASTAPYLTPIDPSATLGAPPSPVGTVVGEDERTLTVDELAIRAQTAYLGHDRNGASRLARSCLDRDPSKDECAAVLRALDAEE